MTSSLPRKCSTTELKRLINFNERETRFELATYSLEGCRSTNWATPALSSLNAQEQASQLTFSTCLALMHHKLTLWGEKDSNLRKLTLTELQSVPFGRSGTSPSVLSLPIEETISLLQTTFRRGRVAKGVAKLTAFWCKSSSSTKSFQYFFFNRRANDRICPPSIYSITRD